MSQNPYESSIVRAELAEPPSEAQHKQVVRKDKPVLVVVFIILLLGLAGLTFDLTGPNPSNAIYTAGVFGGCLLVVGVLWAAGIAR